MPLVPLVFEYEAVLLQQREQLALTPADVADVVDGLCALAIPHNIYFLGDCISEIAKTNSY